MSSNSVAPKYVRYVPAQAGAQPKIIRMVEVQKDPMEPAKFKINQKIPAPPPSPPAPVMHSPPRKITAEEQNEWKIPPCVSSWKNPRGYTVPLDKRCAFNGRNGAQPLMVNSKFAKLSEALYIATKQHREALEDSMKAEKLLQQKEKEKKEEQLRLLAQQAREERAAVQRSYGRDNDDSEEDGSTNTEEVKERKRIREERHRERVRDINIKASNPGKRTKFDRHRERDISEQIALNMAKPNTLDNDVHDQRLYNQSQGISSGFGEDDEYAVYDKAWKSQASFSSNYRPTANITSESKESDMQDDDNHPNESTAKHDVDNDPLAPIQFDKDDDDLFNVVPFLEHAKHYAQKQRQEQSSHSTRRHKS